MASHAYFIWGADAVRARAEMKTNRISTLTEFEDLMLNFQGFIDLNSADSGQLGWGNAIDGGFFSKFFSQNLLGLAPENGWRQSLNEIDQNVNQFYQQKRSSKMSYDRAPQQMIDQNSLTPQVFEMQVSRAPYHVNPGTREFTTITRTHVRNR